MTKNLVVANYQITTWHCHEFYQATQQDGKDKFTWESLDAQHIFENMEEMHKIPLIVASFVLFYLHNDYDYWMKIVISALRLKIQENSRN